MVSIPGSSAEDAINGRHLSQDTSNNHFEEEAMKYLKEHKIIDFFENLTAALVYEKPDDPRDFAMKFIEKLQKSQNDPDIDAPCPMDESNLESVFGMLDITKTGYITRTQYLKAMESLGVIKFNYDPLGCEFNKINKDTFIREAKTALEIASATFSEVV